MDQKEGYKKTKIGWIPEDWGIKPLGDKDLSEKITQGPNPKYKLGNPSASFRALKTKDLYDSQIKYSNADSISPETFQGCKASELKDKDILVAIVGRGSIGKSNMFRVQNGICYLYTRAIGLIRANQNVVQPDFINQYFQSYKAKNYFDRGIGGSTGQEVLQTSTLKAMPFPIPPLPEQKKIAEILTTADDKISSIDNQIQQTEQLKKGLMEKFLTEGIGHTEFKDTKIGRMPKGWDVERLGEKCDVRDGTHYSPKYHDTGIPFITSKNLKPWGVDFTDIKYISEEDHIDFSRRSHVENGDILFGMIGTVGNPVIVQADFKFSIKNVALIKLANNSVIHNKFLLSIFNSSIVDKQFRKISNGGVLSFVALGAIRNLFVPLPTLDEQKQIASILSTVDDKIGVLNQKKSQYQTLKKGLSQQLLTGQMRVKV